MRKKISYVLALLGSFAVAVFAICTLHSHEQKMISLSPFLSACYERLREQKYQKNADAKVCENLERKLFRSQDPIQTVNFKDLKSPDLPMDDKVRSITFYDPHYFSYFGYCYFAFRGWFDPTQMTPKQLSLAGAGFAILKSELAGYPEWLKSEKGQACVKSVNEISQIGVADLGVQMGDKISIIAFNPVGAIRSDNGIPDVLNEGRLTFNHERIHAIHVVCPKVDEAARQYWNSLSAEEKTELKVGHLNYDWNNNIVAVREAFAYYLEEDPVQVTEYMGDCR